MRVLPEDATPEQHLRMVRLWLVGISLILLSVILVAVILIIVRQLGGNPSAAMTALLGAIVGGLPTAINILAQSLSGSVSGERDSPNAGKQ